MGTQIAAKLPEVLPLMQQVGTAPGPCYVAIDLTHVLSIPTRKQKERQFAFTWREEDVPFHLTLRAVSALLLFSLGACTSQFPQTIMHVFTLVTLY